MRIAYVSTDPGVPVFGRKGASAHVRAVVGVLLRAGVEVHLVCARTGGDVPADLAGVHVHRLPRVTGADVAERERSAAACDAAVPAVLDRIAADGPLDLVMERYALWGRSATAWAQDAGVASVLEVNAPLVQEQARHRGLVDRVGAEAVAVDAVSQATSVVCVSEPVARWARSLSSSPGRVRVVANGVDTTRVRPRPGPVTPADADTFTVGFVGTLKPWHGVATLVDALALLVRRDPGYRLLLVGDGPEAEALRAQAARAGVAGDVELTGAVDPSRVPALLHRMDVACAPYPALDDFYFSPLKAYEYFAAGLPVVASTVGELPGLLRHGHLGALVPPDDPRALADAVAGLRADTTRRTALRDAGATVAAAEHDWERVVDRVLAGVGLVLPATATGGRRVA